MVLGNQWKINIKHSFVGIKNQLIHVPIQKCIFIFQVCDSIIPNYSLRNPNFKKSSVRECRIYFFIYQF